MGTILRVARSALLAMVLVGPAMGQYQSGFESLVADPDGELLTGQDGYYIPPGGGADYRVFTYADNTIGVPQNPDGGRQFISGTGTVTQDARAQRDLDFGGSRLWTVHYDFAGSTTSDYLIVGSFSLQDFDSVSGFVQFVEKPQSSPDFLARYSVYDAEGNGVFVLPPLPAWRTLEANHWYRLGTTFDLSTNQITEVSITDLVSGNHVNHAPDGWYLQGGADPNAFGDPTAFRFFTLGEDGSVRVAAWDNVQIIPEPASLILIAWIGAALIRRRRAI